MDSIFSIFRILADWLTYDILHLEQGEQLTESVHFFIYDVTKILALLIIIIYLVGLARASLDMERIRTYLQGKNRFLGYLLASFFGAITPFCSCSSIPLFLGFTAARIPVGITMAFLITSPIINEVALLLLGSMLGIKFMISYLIVGVTAGVLGGIFFDFIKAERFLTPMGEQSTRTIPLATIGGNAPTTAPGINMASGGCCSSSQPLPPMTSCCDSSKQIVSGKWEQRHQFAKIETIKIVTRVWKWILVGVAAGAVFHGFVPQEWVETNLGGASWWSVPVASLLGIPLYADATSIVPIAESMLNKGVPVGTMLTFMMSVVGASFPEFILLKQVMQTRMLVLLFVLLLVIFSITGWIFNALSPWLGF